jgi:hypothetical protein
MLSQEDIEWIKGNRTDLTQNRTEPITIIHVTVVGEDPYTHEEIINEVSEIVNVVWSESTGKNERDYFGGIELLENDVVVSFEPTVNLTDVEHIIRQNKKYEIVAIDERGIGEINRYETVARLVK